MVRLTGALSLSVLLVMGILPALPSGSAAAVEPPPATLPEASLPIEGARAFSPVPVTPSKGTPWAWGWGSSGALGNNATAQQNAPVRTQMLGSSVLAAGDDHSLGLKSDGTLWASGGNLDGQLCDGTTTNRLVPTQSSLTDVRATAAGGFHTLAAKADGTVWACGDNDQGQLGNGTTNTAANPTPSQVTGLTGVTAVAGGRFFSVALKSDGTVWAWGENASGQLGDGTMIQRSSAVQVVGVGGTGLLSGISAIAAGNGFVLALKSDGTLYAWGANPFGQLGDGTTAQRSTPAPVSILTGVVSIAAGSGHSLAAKSDGTVWGWGSNFNGQVGDNTTTSRNAPTQVVGPGGSGTLAGVASVGGSNGGNHSHAVKSDGTLWSWGNNGNGQLGDGTTTQRNAPVQVSGLTAAGQVAGGKVFTLANQSVALQPPPPGTERNRPLINGALAGLLVATGPGSFTTSKTDVTVAGRGPVPTVTRSYDSNDTRVGAFGKGWKHSYEVRLVDPGDGGADVVLVGPLGRSDRYVASGGTYVAPPGVLVSLTRNDDGSYTATGKDQSTRTFDGAGRLTALTDRYGNASTLAYNASGQLASVGDPAGRGSLALAYHPSGRLASVTDWLSPARIVQYSYDASLRLETVTDRAGGVTRYSYYADDRIATVTDPRGNVSLTLTYDAGGRVQTQKDARGLVTGQATSFTSVDNGNGTFTTTTTYPVASFGAWAATVADTYSSTSGWLTSRVSRPSATETYTTSYSYDAAANPLTVTDPRGNTTSFCYDADYAGVVVPGSTGNLTRVISPPAGGPNPLVELLKYDAKNNLIQQYPPKGVANGATVTCATNLSATLNATYATDLAYDAPGAKLLAVTRRYTDPDLGAKTATTKFEYADAANPGLVTKLIPPRGNPTGTPDYSYATTLAYGASGPQAGMLLTATDALGNKATATYDAIGRRLTSVDPIGNAAGGTPANHRTDYVYDAEDRPTFVKLPAPVAGGAQLVSESRYDPAGNRTVALDANGQVTKFLYDERNRLAEAQESPSVWTDPALTPSPLYRTTYAYDHLGSLSRITRAAGDTANERALDMTYDGAGRQRTETQYPAWPATSPALTNSFAYDGNGNPTTLTDPLGRTVTSGYDALDRLSSTTFSDGSTPNVTYAYDAHGHRSSMADGTGTTAYTCDELDRLLSVTTPGPKTVAYRYDADGHRRKLIYPDGTAVTYTIDKGQRLTTLAESTRTTSYLYREDGSPKTVTFPNATTASYAYDNARRLTALTNASSALTLTDHRYTMDAVGNRTRVDEVLAQPGAAAPSAFGDNASGQLGDNSTTDRSSPIAISALGTPTQLAAGGLHSLALMAGGTVKAWGENADGQIGNNSSTDQKTPLAVSGMTGAIALGAGGGHSLAVLADGTVRSWGRNANGQLGNGSTTLSRVPVTVSGLGSVSAASGGTAHTLALKSDGTAWAWGLRTNGRLGVGAGTGNQTTPVQVSGLTSVRAVAAGGAHSLALKADGTVWAFGFNLSGQLGDNTTTERLAPVQVKDPAGTGFLAGVVAIAAGGDHSLALKADGTLFAWGSNLNGQIGDNTSGSANNRKLPVQVKGPGGVGFLTTVASIEAGTAHSVAAKGDGTVWAWGLGTDGRLGNGSTAQQPAPVQAGTLALVTKVAAGDKHTLAHASVVKAEQYAYDRLSRLTQDNSTAFSYDPVGNRTAMAGTTYIYDRADRITAAGSTAYSVNDAGNLVARGADSFAYDQANRLTGATIAATTTTYAYDGDGVRVSRVQGGTTAYVHDRAGGLPVVLDDGTRRYIFGPAGLAYSLQATTPAISHADGLGSVRTLSDAAGAPTQRYSRDAFGNSTATQGPSTQPFGFTGELNDSSTGLLHLRARDYDPASGRFLQRDARLNGGGSPSVSLNRYSYAGNNPVSNRDPSGRAFTSDGGNDCMALSTDGCSGSVYTAPDPVVTPPPPPATDPISQAVSAVGSEIAAAQEATQSSNPVIAATGYVELGAGVALAGASGALLYAGGGAIVAAAGPTMAVTTAASPLIASGAPRMLQRTPTLTELFDPNGPWQLVVTFVSPSRSFPRATNLEYLFRNTLTGANAAAHVIQDDIAVRYWHYRPFVRP